MKSIKFNNGSEIVFSDFDKSDNKLRSLTDPPAIPLPPPMREMSTSGIWKNEWETVQWYTDTGSRYPRKISKWNIFFDKKLRDAYSKSKNREITEEQE